MKGEMKFLTHGAQGVKILTPEELGCHLIVSQTKNNPLFLRTWNISSVTTFYDDCPCGLHSSHQSNLGEIKAIQKY